MSRYKSSLMLALGWLALAIVPAGCATHADYLREIRHDFYAGELDHARKLIDDRVAKHGNDGDVLKLDKAMIELVSGHPHESEQLLREVRDSLDYLQQKSLAEGTVSMLTDDNAMSYPGEDYERILIRAFLALSNLMGDGGDALAYGLQLNEVQDAIIQTGHDETGQNPKANYKRVALGAYLFGALREADHFDYDDAARYWTKVVSWEPSFPYGPQDVQRAEHGVHSARGNGVLYVFTLVGRGPCKQESKEIASSVSLLIADRILSATMKHTLPPTIAPIKVPKVVRCWSRVHYVDVAVDRQPVGGTATLTDVGQTAVEQGDAVFPSVVARAVVRRVIKKGAIYAAKEVTKTTNNSWANLGLDVLGVAWEATEAADTRCWGLLPDRIQVLRVELPAGQHTISLRPASPETSGFSEATTNVQIADGHNTYVLATFADDRLVGKILSNTH